MYSNTELILDGTIRMAPNELTNYSILYINNAQNVTVRGGGGIIGDKYFHTANKGEWGIWVYILKSEKVKVCEIKVEYCWGDSIYM